MPALLAQAGRLVEQAAAHFESWLISERTQLPLWAPVGLGIGIVAYFLLPWAEQRLAVAISAAGLGVAWLAMRGVVARVFGWGGLLIALGIATAQYRADAVAGPILRSHFSGVVAGTVTAVEIRSGRGQVRFQLAPTDTRLPPEVRISMKSSATSIVPKGLLPGAKVSLRAALSPPARPSYPGGYDFARRAWFQGLGATGYPMGPLTITAAAVRPAGAKAWLDSQRALLTTRVEGKVGGGAGRSRRRPSLAIRARFPSPSMSRCVIWGWRAYDRSRASISPSSSRARCG